MDDNLFQTFQLEGSNLRGRILRMGSSINDILDRHGYPDGISVLTGQAAILALLLSSMLKYDGIFTLQTSSDGPVSMLVSDITNRGVVRACATYDPSRLRGDLDPASLMGAGHLAFTVDQGADMERYQGIVSLTGGSLQESVQHYFTQSEQIATGIRIAVGRDASGQWRAGGIMLQRLPEEGGINNPGESEEDDWRRTMILLQSCKDEELLDAALSQNDLLFRLFHEEGVRVYEPTRVEEGCRCSQERAERIIATMSDEDRDEMTVDGRITVTCEFCSREYIFDETDTNGNIQAS